MSWPSSEQTQNTPKLPQLRASMDLDSPQMGMQTGLDGASPTQEETADLAKISAYARLDFDQYTFFVQTLQVVLGRKSSQEFLSSAHHSVDVHLSSKKAISRRHAKIFYNFGTQRFEISVLGRNGAFVDDSFVAKGITVPLLDTTKIQIGDIPFTFVLPSLEAAEADDARHPSAKLFNPTDALNLRSNLYLGTAGGGLPKRTFGPKKDPVATAAAARRNSKADIVRRLSIARRKSLALSSNDEINALLKELETFNAGGEPQLPTSTTFDPDLLDAEVKSLLHTSASLTHEELQKEEDEIDALVKQHNLSEGVGVDVGVLAETHKLPQDLAMDLNLLDQEVASLAPLMDAENHSLNVNDDAVRKPHVASSFPLPLAGAKSGISKTNSLQHLELPLLIGKPMGAGPRMGKPATIQPPANRIYGRPSVGSIGSIGSIGHSIPNGGITGQLPMSHLSTVPGALPPQLPPGFAITAPPGYPAYNAYGASPYSPLVRPLPPKLEVPVETITRVPVTYLIIPFRAITVEAQVQKRPPVCIYKTAEKPSGKPKLPVRRKDAAAAALRKTVKMQNPKDIPDQYKAKPTVTILAMISTVLRTTTAEKKGYTIGEIHDKIRELFPYYRYCPDGWQFPVTHNVKFNKTFTAVAKPELPCEWLYAIDHAYVEEKEKIRKKQQDAAMAKAKEAALRLRPHMPPVYGTHLGRPYMATDAAHVPRFPVQGTPLSLSLGAGGGGANSAVTGAGAGTTATATAMVNGLQRPKSIAEIASEIKREGQHSFTKTPLYFQRKSPVSDAVRGTENGLGLGTGSNPLDPERFLATIKDQLAANRAKVLSSSGLSLGSPIPVPQLGKPPSSMGAAGQFKGRPPPVPKLHAPVSVSAVKAPVAVPAKTAPVAVPAAAKPAKTVSQATVTATRAPPPAKPAVLTPMNADTKKSLGYLQKELFTLYKARNLTYNTMVTTEIITKALATTIAQVNIIGAKAGCGENALSFLVEKAPQQVSKILDIALTKSIKEKQSGSGQTSRAQTPQPAAPSPLEKKFDSRPSSTTPTSAGTSNVTPTSSTAAPSRMAYVGLSKPQSFTKPGGLAKPPQFVSNKPRPLEKRASDEKVPEGKKVLKIED